MRGYVPRRRISSKLPASLVDSTQYQLDFLSSVCDNDNRPGEIDASTSTPPNHSRGVISAMTSVQHTTQLPQASIPTPRRTYPQDWPSYSKAPNV